MFSFTRYIQNYLIYALPAVILTALWSQFGDGQNATGALGVLWEICSWVLMIWFALLIVFLVTLLTYAPVREQTILRLARIQERDEREEQITGTAARSSFIVTMALLIFLIFISVFKIHLRHISPSDSTFSEEGSAPSKTLSLGFGLKIFDVPNKTDVNGVIFESTDIPLSKSALLILVLMAQAGAFWLSVRRQTAKDVADDSVTNDSRR